MKPKIYAYTSLTLLLFGFVFFLYQESWIILFIPYQTSRQTNKIAPTHTNKEIVLWLWNNTTQSFQKETTEILYSNDINQNIKLILNSWFLLLEEEGFTDKQINVQTVALCAHDTDAFISLNQYPFDEQASTHQKLMVIQSLLKTLKDNQIPILSIRLLIHHQPLIDEHLNFDISWPIHGYMTTQTF